MRGQRRQDYPQASTRTAEVSDGRWDASSTLSLEQGDAVQHREWAGVVGAPLRLRCD